MADEANPAFEESDLGAIIAAEIRNSQAYDASDYSDTRVLALEYMRGEMPDLPPRPNGSRQTSRDVADTVNAMLPGIVRTFTASDQMVQYDLVEEGNEEWASEATDYTNYTFMVENNGQAILYDATYDALVMGNAAPFSYWEPETKETETLKDQSIEQIAMLTEDQNVKILTQKGKGEPQVIEVPGPDGMAMPMEVFAAYDIKIERTTPGKICDETGKPENLLINDTATDIDTARFVAYLYDDKTRSDLIEMGFDPEIVESLPSDNSPLNSTVNNARYHNQIIDTQSPVRSMDRIDLYRAFPHVDVDDDGIAERLEVWYAGNIGGGKVLDWSVWEGDVPYTDIPCYPVPHRYRAESVYDRSGDIARVNTVLLRQALDNTYASGISQKEVDIGSVLNPDILVNPKFGGLIWKKAGSKPIIPHVTAYTADKSFAAMQIMSEILTKRTGVSRATMALDPDTLQNQTAEAARQNHDASVSQVDLVARNMAEGWRRFFQKRLKLAVKHGTVRKIPSPKSQEKFREVDPSRWNANMAVTINVGLGTGSRDRDMAMLNSMIQGQVGMAQQLALPMPNKAIEFIPKIRMAAVKLAESAGIRNPESFYPEITDEDVQAAQQKAEQQANAPDPKIAESQAKAQSDQQLQQMKMQGDQQEAMARMQLEREKMEGEFALRREQTAQELALKREQLGAELQLKREQTMAELALQRELGHAGISTKANGAGTSVHVGGEPG